MKRTRQGYVAIRTTKATQRRLQHNQMQDITSRKQNLKARDPEIQSEIPPNTSQLNATGLTYPK